MFFSFLNLENYKYLQEFIEEVEGKDKDKDSKNYGLNSPTKSNVSEII